MSMTPREARHAVYAAAQAVDQYMTGRYGNLREYTFDILDDVLEGLRVDDLGEAA